MPGLTHVYTGKGKGKTTAAIGLGIRAVGAGLKVCMIQFVKGRRDSAFNVIEKIDDFDFKQFGEKGIRRNDNFSEKEKDLAKKALKEAKMVLQKNNADLLILDEINVAMNKKLIDPEKILEIIRNKPKNLELVLTGRYANKKIKKESDLVTRMENEKHYFQKKIKARKGIDY